MSKKTHASFNFTPSEDYGLLLKQANAMANIIRAIEAQRSIQSAALDQMKRDIALRSEEEIAAQRNTNQALTVEIEMLRECLDKTKSHQISIQGQTKPIDGPLSSELPRNSDTVVSNHQLILHLSSIVGSGILNDFDAEIVRLATYQLIEKDADIMAFIESNDLTFCEFIDEHLKVGRYPI